VKKHHHDAPERHQAVGHQARSRDHLLLVLVINLIGTRRCLTSWWCPVHLVSLPSSFGGNAQLAGCLYRLRNSVFFL